MKNLKLLSVLFIAAVAASCSSVHVSSDYDEQANFATYKTYGFFKDGIDKADISDLDKKRIMRAIDDEFAKKGYTKSDKPDLLVNIFTKSRKEVNVGGFNSGWGWGYGWGWGGGPWGWGGNYTSVRTETEGTLYIDLVDPSKQELVWQGVGTGVLTQGRDKKQQLINEFVAKILAQFPPERK
ncbi:MAG: DUF4136 domain-containing protein [Flavobacterium sp.]